MTTGAEIRDWIQLGLIGLLAAKSFGQFWQKREDTSAANAEKIDRLEKKHDTEIADLKARVADEHDATAGRFSKSESKLENLRSEMRKEYVLKDVCDERTAASSKERNHDHPHSPERGAR